MTEAMGCGYVGRTSRALYDNWTDYVPTYHSYYKSYKKIESEKRRTRRQRKVFTLALIFAAVIFFAAARSSAGEKDSAALTHCVRSGDTLWSIARQYKPDGMDTGEYVYKIKAANGMKTSNLDVGDGIIIP